jgi:hypothetical protein
VTIASAAALVGSVFLVFALVGGLVASIAHPLVEKHTARWSPDAAHRALLLLAVAPPVLAASATLAAFAPSILALGWPTHQTPGAPDSELVTDFSGLDNGLFRGSGSW